MQENEENITVEILDSMMGSGKTTAILQWIDTKCNTERFIYVSPLLSEVEHGGRIHRDCKVAKFNSPETDNHDTKSDHLLELLQQGLNISCTHSLYLMMNHKHFEEIKKQEYIVIIDEELGVIENYEVYSESDLDSLIDLECIEKQESDGMLVWKREDKNFDKSNHKYYVFKRYVENGVLYATKRKNSMMVTQLPIKLFTVAKRVILLTYMFEGNVLSSFFKLKGISYKPFTEVVVQTPSKEKIKELITIFTPKNKWQQIDNYKLSSTWYSGVGKENASSKDFDFLSKFIEYFARTTDCTYKEIMFTFPKTRHWNYKTLRGNEKRKLIKPKRLIERVDNDGKIEHTWIATQTRATNDYAHKTHVLHLFNRYPNQTIKAYLQDYDCDVDSDVFALSELVQWVWRSAIRNNEPITLCIASSRMKKLFLEWLDSGY